MGFIVKESLKNSLISYIGILIGTINMLWLFPTYLTSSEIGILKLIQDIPFLLAIFVQLGSSGLMDKYFFRIEEKQRPSFLTIILTIPALGFLFFLISYLLYHDFWISLFNKKSPEFTNYFIYIIPLIFFIIYLTVLEAYLRVNKKIQVPVLLREIITRIYWSALIFIYSMKLFSFDNLVILYGSIYLITLILLIIHLIHQKLLLLKFNFQSIPLSIYKDMGIFVLFLLPGVAGSMIAQKIDSLMIASYMGTGYLGVYAIAFYIGSFTEVPRKSLSVASMPILSQASAEGNYIKIDELYKKNSLIQFLAGLYLFLCIWINIDYLFTFIPNNAIYIQGKYVIFFIGLGKLFDMITSINGEIIQYSKYYKFNIIAILFLGILSIYTNFIFLPIWGITGAALATAITLFLFNALKTIYCYYRFKLHPFSKTIIPIVLLGGLLILLSFYSPVIIYNNNIYINSFLNITLNCLTISILFYITIRYFKVSEEINKLIDKVLTFIKL